MYHPDKVKR